MLLRYAWSISLISMVCALFPGAARSSEMDAAASPKVGMAIITSPRIDKPSMESLKVDNDEIRTSDDALFFKVGEDSYRLEAGTILTHPAANIRVETPNGNVLISKNSVVLVKVEPDISRFFVICESFGGTVRIFTDKNFKKAGSGEELDVMDAASADEATKLVVHDGTRRRRLRLMPVSQRQFIAIDQFSIPDAMMKQDLISDLPHSDHKSRRALYERILKTAAAISICGPAEPYAQHD